MDPPGGVDEKVSEGVGLNVRSLGNLFRGDLVQSLAGGGVPVERGGPVGPPAGVNAAVPVGEEGNIPVLTGRIRSKVHGARPSRTHRLADVADRSLVVGGVPPLVEHMHRSRRINRRHGGLVDMAGHGGGGHLPLPSPGSALPDVVEGARGGARATVDRVDRASIGLNRQTGTGKIGGDAVLDNRFLTGHLVADDLPVVEAPPGVPEDMNRSGGIGGDIRRRSAHVQGIDGLGPPRQSTEKQAEEEGR